MSDYSVRVDFYTKHYKANDPSDPQSFKTRSGSCLNLPTLCAHKKACKNVYFCRKPPFFMNKWWEKNERNNFEDFDLESSGEKSEFYNYVDNFRQKFGMKLMGRSRIFFHKYFYLPWRNHFFEKSYRLLKISKIGKTRFPINIFCEYASANVSSILPFFVTPREGSDIFDIHLFLGLVLSKNFLSYVSFGGMNCIIPNANEKCLNPYYNLYDVNACESATRSLVEGLSAESLTQKEINPNIEGKHYPNKIIEAYSPKALIDSNWRHGPYLPSYKHCFLCPIEIDLDKTSSELLDNVLFQENEKGKWMKCSNFATLKIESSNFFDKLRMGHKKSEDFINGEGFFQMKCVKKLKMYQKKLTNEPPIIISGCFGFVEGDFDDARVGMKKKDLGEEKFSHFDFSGVSEVQRNGIYKLDPNTVMEILAFEEELKEIERIGLRNFKCIAKVEL